MKKIAIVLVFLALAAALMVALVAPNLRLRDVPLESLDRLMQAFHKNGRRHGINSPFNGVLLVADGGEVVFHEAYGLSDPDSGTPLSTDARFLIGSVSKQFTAMLVLQLVDRGVLSLDQSVADLIKWFPADRGSELTLHRLLSHTAGVQDFDGLRAVGYDRHRFYNETLTPREYAELIAEMPPAYEPGEDYLDTNLDYVLLGVVLEEVTGKSYAELLRENITEPLGLDDTGFGGNDFVAEQVAPDYHFDGFSVVRTLFLAGRGEFETASFRDQSTTYSGSGMHSTAADLLRWTQALRGQELLSPELSRLMMTPNRWGYGYGLYRNPEELFRENPNATLVAHGGAVTEYHAFVGMYDDGTTLIALSNVGPLDMERVVHKAHLAATGNALDKGPINPSLRGLQHFDDEGGVAAFVEYYEVLTERAGYPICPGQQTLARVINLHLERDRDEDAVMVTETVAEMCAALDDELLNATGYAFLRNDRLDDALRFLRLNVELHPQVANVYDSLGEGLEEKGDLEQARASYARAVELGEAQGDPALRVYQRHLEDVRSPAGDGREAS